MSTKKFSQLPALDALADNDLFAVTDTDSTQSKKVTGTILTSYVLSSDNIEAKTGTIVTKINELNPTVGNNLKATNLYVSSALGYKPASYFLAWDNVTGKPNIPTDLTDLQNSTDFVSYDSDTGTIRVSGSGSTARGISSDNITEGTDNLFHTSDRVDDRLEINFGRLYNTYSSAFDGGTVTESLQDVPGTFRNIDEGQSNIVRVTDPSVADNFVVGQTLRVYGAGSLSEEVTTTPTFGINDLNVSAGFSENVSGIEFSYKLAKYSLISGEIGPIGTERSINVYNAGNDVLSAFNTTNFVKLDITGVSNTEGVAVYRRIGGAPNQYKLLAVLGPKDLQVTPWKDYHTFDYTSWSGKNSSDNTYSSITHFPLTAHTSSRRGWRDVTIQSINKQTSFFDISFGDTYVYVNPDGAVQLAHNDTAKINEAILTKSSQGRKSITLNAKTYNATHIGIPDDFGILGTANITKVKKLPWSGYKASVPNNNLITAITSSGSESISLVGIDFDGNVKSQYLLIDDADQALNYLIDFKTGSDSILIETCRFRNMIGGGIYATSPNEFKISTSEITNSGVTDRFQFSPLIVDGGTTTMVTGNRLENFSDAVNASISSEAVLTNNIIKACGSGLFIYGSRFTLSSPNVLIGPANEFLASPDILNTEYDLINIYRETLPISGPFTSQAHTYQENGQAFDLTQNPINIPAVIKYRANLVKKLSNGSDEIYGNRVGPSAKDINGTTFPTNTFGMISGNRYTILEAGNTNWIGIGAPNNNPGTYFTYNGVAPSQANSSVATSGLARSSEFAGYGNVSVTGPISIQNVGTGVDPSSGEFKFQLSENTIARIKDGIYAPSNLQTLYDADIVAGNQPAGSTHVGIAWSASIRYYTRAATISQIGSWDISSDTTNPTYIVTVTMGSDRLPIVKREGDAQGTIVRIHDHTNFAMYSQVGVSHNYGEVVNIIDGSGPNQKILYIKFWAGGDPNGSGVNIDDYGLANGDADGTINIIDDFVMAQGLIK